MRNRLQFNSFSFPGMNAFVAVMTMMCLISVKDVAAQCNPDQTSPTIVGCSNKVVALTSGQCSVLMKPQVYAFDNCPGNAFTVTHNTANTQDGVYACDPGTTNFYQVFTPAISGHYTPIRVTNVDVGIYKTVNNVNLTVRVYKTDGSLIVSNWTPIGSQTVNLVGGLSNTTASVGLSSSLINPSETFAIEVIAPASIAGDSVVAYNATGQLAPTYVKANACGVTSLTDLASLTEANASALVAVTVQPESVYFEPYLGNPYAADDYFAAGVYNLNYRATDAAGNTAICNFTLTVNGVANPVSSITCNDKVNISLDDNCEAVVTADEILEGGPYGCFDNYIVTIFNSQNQPIGNVLDASHVGKTLRVSVKAPNDNSCWGEILVEDKNAPVLDCFPVYTTCAGELKPGSLLPQRITYKADVTSDKIDSANPSSNTYNINVFGLKNVTINDLDVMINIDHSGLPELSATLESPSGTFVNLFGGPGSNVPCVNPGLFITLDDGAMMTHADLQNACGATNPAIMGNFRPWSALSAFNGEDPTGVWKLTINDDSAGNGGLINSLAIVIGQSGARIPFPTMEAVTFSEVSPNTYIVNGIDPCGPATLTYQDEVIENDCDSDFLKIIRRTWNAVDARGNASVSCDQLVYVYRNGLATLKFPPNYDGIQRPTLSCTQWGMTIPPPTNLGTGKPEGDFCENIQIFPPEDTKIDICAKSYKLIRKWKVVEWCSGQVIEHTQIIKVEDKEGPSMVCPPDVTLSTDPLDCHRDYTVQFPEVSDYGCSDESQIDWTLSYYYAPGGTLPNDAIFTPVIGITIKDVPMGVTYVRYTATDDCGNASTCTQKVTIVDQVPPVAVCDQFTTVSVGSNGEAMVDAITFDDGSHDNCSLAKIDARKMTNACPGGTTTQFRDKLIFCCAEVMTSIMVELRVTDKSGNSNTCMVEARIQDKLPPYITCPPDITIDCFQDHKDLDLTGEPTYIDNCAVVSVEHTDSGNVDNCGEGTIRRTWTVKDKANFAASCVQFVYLRDLDPFDANDIIWPLDYDATTCNADLSPENLPLVYGYPRLANKNCSLTSMTYKDQVFTFVDGSCEKILRTWTIIDWCTYNENTGAGLFTYPRYVDALQIIKLTNNIKPVFASCSNRTADIFGNCEGEVTQEVSATDDCTPAEQLKYNYTIDVANDGVGPFLTGTGRTFTRTLPIGVHKITWVVEDKCGNKETCMYLLTVRDGKKPTPYCLTTVTTVVMPSTGSIEIWAKDFDYGSYDNCTPKPELEFSFTSNINSKFRTFTCEDIPDGKEMYIPIEMWVHDKAGNKDFCSIGLILQDGIGDVCEDITRLGLAGKVTSEDQKSIKGVEVMAKTMGTEVILSKKTTDNTGAFRVEAAAGSDVQIIGEKTDNIMNGISTLDLVIIQRHILSLELLPTPYKIIAADVNNDAKISASDLVALRKVILGITNTYPNDQKVWRFADGGQTFANPLKPFPYTEKFEFSNLQEDHNAVNFIGIKIGDVNGSAKLNARDEDTQNRSSFEMTYNVEKEGRFTYIPVYAQSEGSLSGLQMEVATNGAAFSHIEAGALGIGEGDVYIDGDKLKLSYAPRYDQLIIEGDVLFTLVVEGQIDGELQLERENLNAEVYFSDLSEADLQLRSSKQTMASEISLLQNKPNPFSEATSIGFILPEAGDALLEVFDMNGRLLWNLERTFEKGQHEIQLTSDELPYTGVLYYQLTFGQQKAIRKMVFVR